MADHAINVEPLPATLKNLPRHWEREFFDESLRVRLLSLFGRGGRGGFTFADWIFLAAIIGRVDLKLSPRDGARHLRPRRTAVLKEAALLQRPVARLLRHLLLAAYRAGH